MNKKLLFAAMSLAALTACTDNDFESKNVANVAGETSPVQFEVINANDVTGTRASLGDLDQVVWSAEDKDLFTLYNGATVGQVTGHKNATYTANLDPETQTAVLTTPSMIYAGGAVMVWPVDTTFRYDAAGGLTIKIPAGAANVQGGLDENKKDILQYQIPYMSDEITIGNYAEWDESTPALEAATTYNVAGKNRRYPVCMRPMASVLNLRADWVGMDVLNALADGEDAIEPIKLTSVDLLTTGGGGTTNFTEEINVQFTAPGTFGITPATQWTVANNAWTNVTDFGAVKSSVDQLTTESLNENKSCKFIILPQPTIPAAGVDDGGVCVNTIYGKVVVANQADADNHGSQYDATEIADAWYRYVTDPTKPSANIDPAENVPAAAETSGEGAGKFKVTSEPKIGMEQTINVFSSNKAAGGYVKGEPQGASTTRYVKVLLKYLDMTDLHITSDKQLYDAVRVWDKLGLKSVTVYLDGDANKQFEISQKTIKKINEINAAASGRFFGVKPCNAHTCDEIVVTGGDKIEDMTFIFLDGTHDADVVLKGGETWKWDGTVKIAAAANTGISGIINRGTLENAAANILNIKNPAATAVVNIPFKNDLTGKWNITAGRIRVQNSVENLGTLTISKGAQFIEDDAYSISATFTNNANTLENRFIGGSGQEIGTVINKGVFATLGTGVINNYSLIEHADKDAKTYITHNETSGADFATAFGAGNMKGRINLPYSNKDEDNISISADPTAPFEGFISVTVDGDAPTSTLNAGTVGTFVNYMIVKSGIDDISYLPSQVEYVEVDTDHEVYWSIPTATLAGGLIVLSDVNVKLGTTLDATTATYLGKEMYVGGTFTTGSWDGYYGATNTRVAEHYITY